MTYYYYTEKDIRQEIDVLLQENASIQCNLGLESTDAERKEADDKWKVIAAKIKTLDIKFYRERIMPQNK
tara:strand:+ start:479 stop:688 length:210 start_codon:yes stop_codon:yes gene_type:complete